MQYYIIILATFFALFWDELIIAAISCLVQKRLSVKFMIIWTLVSGLLAALLVAMHVPEEYRGLTVVMIGIAVVFSMHGYQKAAKEKTNELLA
jgi:Na+-translocating ferredoxin:NAD+ oxidoreductase RnfD subunit